MPTSNNWIEDLLPLPRPEYAKQTESLLTDLLWRSEGSSLAARGLLAELAQLKSAPGFAGLVEPDRLVPQRRHGGSQRLQETLPIAKATNTAAIILQPPGTPSPINALLRSLLAPRARGDKSDACVPIHPSVIALQTLHGLVNKDSPSNLAKAIETMAWLGGAPTHGSAAASYLALFTAQPADPKQGLTGFIDSLLPEIARHVWVQLPAQFHATPAAWPAWPGVQPATPKPSAASLMAQHTRTPFRWFWQKWQTLCAQGWYDALPARRFTDWALCLLRTGLAFSYLWEAELFCRLHECFCLCASGSAPADALQRVRSLLQEGTILASIEPFSIPASQKDVWTALSELIARGYEARKAIDEWDAIQNAAPPAGNSVCEKLQNWLTALPNTSFATLSPRLQIGKRTANNQKEFVRYLMLPRSSDDDLVDQADFYYLARTNSSRSVWLHPGPEWLVVIASLLCQRPGGQCTLGQLLDDLSVLGIQVERSVLVALLEQAGLSTDSPDADNAIVIRAGF
jgi:hypothetical protein